MYKRQADQYPDVKFIAIDVTQGDIGTDAIPANCYCITFKAVSYTHLDVYKRQSYMGPVPFW